MTEQVENGAAVIVRGLLIAGSGQSEKGYNRKVDIACKRVKNVSLDNKWL